MKIKVLCIALLAAFSLSAQSGQAQNKMGKNGYPIYLDCSVPVPNKPLNITRDDLQLTDKYLKFYPEGITYANAEGLRRLYEFYKNDPEGRKEWTSLQNNALKCIPTWDLSKILGERNRYMYAFLKMKSFAELYIFTGNELVSDFIRCHLAKAADLPIDFWMHAELRKLDPKKPKGYLESSHISRMLGSVITAVRRNMTPEEIEKIETAWHEKAFIPMLNWLETPSMGNFTAVISCGVLYAAKYFKDKAAWDRGVWGLRYYVEHTIEKDGSDGEGYGYYSYPAGLLFEAAMIMNRDEMRQVFDGSDLDKVMTWRVYGQMFDEDETGMTMRISYGDNNYRGLTRHESDIPAALSRYVYKDGLAEWMWRKYELRTTKNVMLLDAKFPNLKIKPVSPAEAGLPLIKAFDTGDCFIRSDWNPGGILLGLKSGDCASRINNAHNRPELNSLTLGAYGEYFIVTCGSASYRSTIRKKYDTTTRAANTITIDDSRQKYPGLNKVTRAEQLPDGTYFLRSDVIDTYDVKTIEGSFRSVQFIPEGGFFIVRDFLGTRDGLNHKYDYRFHIFNRDEKTTISGPADFLKVSRPKADLYIALNKKLDFTRNDDVYMHGPNARDYDPDGPNQGKLGSAIELDWSCKDRAIDVCAVLFPAKKDASAPKVKWGKGSVTVNGKTYKFLDEAPSLPDAASSELTLTFNNAAKFVYDGGAKKFGPRQSGQKDAAATYANAGHGEFWSSVSGLEEFKFSAGTACNWDGYLCGPVGSFVRLPKVKGYRLASVEILSIKNSGNKRYKITGAEGESYSAVPAVAGGEECVINKADASTASHVWKITDASAKDYYLTCAGELAAMFSLVYVPVKGR